jgi:WD40 repeat protein/tRNA A-37 threonylcarbamoyl transferase component Bud32
MSPESLEQRRRVDEIFASACDLPPADRDEYILRASGGDADIHRQLQELLAALAAAGGFLNEPTIDMSPDTLAGGDAAGSSGIGGSFPPGFEAIEELGQGGMGTVYKARQTRLNRIVAVKFVTAPLSRHDALFRTRFKIEAEAMAALRHPNIVPVYELGDHAGRPYLVMEFAEGGSLAANLKDRPPPDVRQAAALVESIARGTHHAHERGIIHRDLKPQNILLATPASPQDAVSLGQERWTPKITDFGLAKFAEGAAAQSVTLTSDILGSPGYMSPEQARGDHEAIGVLTDVHALGTILYHLLTGRAPFTAKSTAAALELVRSDTLPASPRSLRQEVPRDLDLVCMKCLQKSPADRYRSAADLAEDLRRFCAGEPVSVKPAGLVERAIKAARRKPTLAAAYVLGGLTLVLGVFGIIALLLYQNAEGARQGLHQQQKQTTAALERETAAKAEESRQRQIAIEARDTEQKARRLLAQKDYVATIDLAMREYYANHLPRARALLESCLPEHRGFEWRLIHRLCHREEAVITLDHRNAPPYSRGAVGVCVSPDGKLFAAAAENQVTVFDAATRKPVKSFNVVGVSSLAFATNDQILAVTGATLYLFDARTGKEGKAFRGHSRTITSVGLFQDGHQILSADESGEVRAWEADTGAFRVIAKEPDAAMTTVAAIDPKGRWLATTGTKFLGKLLQKNPSYDIHLWDVTGGKLLFTLPGHQETVRCLAFTPDGKRLISGSDDKSLRVWDPETGALLNTLKDHENAITGLAVFPDRTRFASTSADGTCRVWELYPGDVFGIEIRRSMPVFRGHEGVMNGVAVAADNRTVITAGHDFSLNIWDTQRSAEFVELGPMLEKMLAVDFSPDGKRLVVGTSDSGTRAFDIPSAALLHELFVGQKIDHVAVDSTGRFALASGNKGEAVLWDFIDDKVAMRFGPQPTPMRRPSTAPTTTPAASSAPAPGMGYAFIEGVGLGRNDERAVIIATTIQVWNRGQQPVIIGDEIRSPVATAVSRDARHAALAYYDGHIALWDLDHPAAPSRRFDFPSDSRKPGDRVSVIRVAFSSDNKRVAAIREDGRGALWDTASGQAISTWRIPPLTSFGIRADFTPDLSRLALSRDDQSVEIWLLQDEAAQLLLTLPTPARGIHSIRFSPDGKSLAVGGGNLFVYVFRTEKP